MLKTTKQKMNQNVKAGNKTNHTYAIHIFLIEKVEILYQVSFSLMKQF